ncbi:preprotein translocase subunit YajC [Spongiactinospora sp. TRM90649]|uniref:preprotein translocase subunit YajC n=1 Tax=Spongiactinospora sp. TRM90649 TaxID=3031114 RepID=UPI0023F8299F|nr:preprotein translocase subunit YajC [Spongiactinospora sp. TRM90649]MDF5751997.1 preprotein translocase subunit YajC [Spongiactinospora sp. TRM90649]
MGGNNALTSFLPLILLVVVFYFLLIRPQRKRQQEQLRMQNSLAPGTRVMTTTGMFATVVAIDGEDVILEIAPGVESRFIKGAIGRVITPVEEEEAETDTTADDDQDRDADHAEPVDGDGKGSSTGKP